MPRGNNISIPSNAGSLQKTLYSERQTILVLNPNNGILYVRMQGSADPTTWDWVVPSQSRAYLPGPWLEYGLFYVDQSGAGATGNVTVFESDQRFDMPDYAAIGVARLAQATSMDIVEGTLPANPGAGIARLWVDTNGFLHILMPNGTDYVVADTGTALGGALTGTLPNPGIANGVIGLASPIIQDGAINAGKIQAKTLGYPQVADASLITSLFAANAVTQTYFSIAYLGNATTSTITVLIPGWSKIWQTYGGDVILLATTPVYNPSTGTGNYLTARIDNGSWFDMDYFDEFNPSGTRRMLGVFGWTTLAAGSHTFDIGWRTTGGTLTQNSAALSQFILLELKK